MSSTTNEPNAPVLGTEAAPRPIHEDVHVSELRYRRLFEAARDGILILDVDTLQITDANPFMTDLLGYSLPELIGKELWELGVFADKEASKEAFRIVQEHGYLRYDDLPLQTKKGDLRDVEFVSNVYDEGNVQVIQCNIRDITERKQREAAQATIEARFQSLFEYAPDGILIASPDSYYLEANASMCRMLGYSREELIGLHAQNIVIPSEVQYIGEALNEAKSAIDHHRVWQFRRKDDSQFAGEVLVTEMPDGNLLAMVRDITDRNAYEEKLNRSQSSLANAQEIAHLGSWELDLPLTEDGETSPLRWSDEVFRIFGYQPGGIEVTNENFFRAAHPDDRKDIETAMAHALSEGSAYNLDHRVILPDGTERIVHEHSEIVFDQRTGEPLKMIGTVQDITERKQIEQELIETAATNAESLALIDTILANAPIGFAFHDLDLAYVRINETLAAINGLSVEQHLGHKLSEILPGMAEALEPIMQTVIGTGKPAVDFAIHGETNADPGELKHWLVSFYPVTTAEGKVLGVGVLVNEVTGRIKAEEQLRYSQEKFAGAFEFAPIGVGLVLPDGRWHQVNRSLCELTGYREAELLELTFQDITHPDDLEGDLNNLQGLIDGEIAFYQMEKRYIHKLGTVVSVLLNVSLLRDDKGAPRYFIAQVQDITERKRADDSLRESESLLAASQRITHLGSWVMDLEGEEEIRKSGERWSDEHYRIFGFEPGQVELTDEFFYNSIHPDDRERLAKTIRGAIAEGKSFDTQHRIILPDGRERTVHAMGELVLDEKTSKPIKLLGSVQDITERKRVEEELQRQQTELRVLFDLMPAMIWFKDTENNIIRINQRAAEAAGLSVGAIEGRSSMEIYPDEAERFYADDLEVLQSRKAKLGYVETLSGPDGQKKWVQTDKVPYFDAGGGPIGIVAMAQDVTDRKNAEIALLESNEKFHQLANNITDVFWIRSPDMSTVYYISPGYEAIWGRPMQVGSLANPKGWLEYIHPDDRRMADEAYTSLMGGGPNIDVEYRIMRPDGELRWVRARGFQVRDRDGSLIRLAGIVTDITEKKESRQALTESEERYRELFENAIDIIYTHDLKGNYTSVNKAAKTITGYSREEALQMNVSDTVAPEYLEKATNMIAAKLAGEDVTAYELELIAKDGHRLTVEVNTRILFDKDEPVGVQGIARDITQRKRTEAALKSIEASFESLFDTANDAILVLSDGRFVDCNPRAESLFGYTKADIIGRTPMDLSPPVQPDGRKPTQKIPLYLGPALEGVPQFFDWQHVRADGSFFDAEVSLNRVDSNGKLLLQAVIRDVTERKVKDAALVASELRYHSLFENMLEGYAYCESIFEGDELTDFTYLEVNRAFELLTGLQNVTGKLVSEVIPGIRKSSPELFEIYGRVTRSGEPEKFDTYVEALDRWLAITVYSSSRTHFVVVFDNITQRRRAEKLLTESQEQLALATSSVNLGIWDWNVVKDELVWNDRMYELYGIKEKDFSGAYEAWQSGLHPDDRVQGDANIRAALDGVRPFNNEFRVTWPNGEIHHIEARAMTERDDDGKAVRMVGVNWDITERKVAEAALAAAEENYRTIFENAVEGIFQSTKDGRFISANPAMARILGYDSPERLLAERVDLRTQHFVDPLCRKTLEKILAENDVAEGYECEVFRRDRSTIWTQESIRTVRGLNGELLRYEGSLADITERKSLAGQLRQSQKMEAVGVLAGGIAHDFNNLLTAINGYSSLTLKKMSPNDRCRHYIEEVKNAGDRAAELTSQLLAFSRKQVLQPVVVNLNAVVSNIEKMLRRIINESIELRVLLDTDIGNIKADPGQLEQVIMNLVINSRDAMPNGGTLSVETQHVYLDEQYVSHHSAMMAGEFVRMTVADTGEGMNAETQSHIFEPFFTTKAIGKGTGLGLSTVYGIVKQSGGDVLVYSEIGHGTTFKIYLPCVAETVRIRKSAGEEVSSRGTETILVVEDEDIVRTFVRTILTGDGYNVLEASDGYEALEVGRSYTEPIHMLLTDLIMPKMSGTELNEQLKKIRPDIKSLFMSGYTDDSISHGGVLISGTAFIEKPFSPESLVRKIREVIDS